MLFVAMGALAAIIATGTSAYASLPGGTTVTAKLKPGTDMTFKGSIDGVSITVTCKSFAAKAVTKKSYTVDLSAPPKISSCTDSLEGKDTINTTGKWSLTESKSKPYTMTLTIPKAGDTFKSSADPGCTITAAPSGSVGVKGSYNGKNTDSVNNAPIPTKGKGCTSTAASTSATVVLSPSPGKPPF